MVEPVPSSDGPDGTRPIDPEAVSVGEVYLFETEEERQVEIKITDCQWGTDDAGDPVPTVISYQYQTTDTSTSGG